MAWQLIFKAPEDGTDLDEPTPAVRKPVSVTLQLDPGTMVVVPTGTVDEDDDDD